MTSRSEQLQAYLELMKEFDKLPPEQKPSANLPELPVWQTKSFVLTSLSLFMIICYVAKIDPFVYLERFGLTGSMSEISDKIMLMMAAFTQMWAYKERMKPNYRLVLGRAKTLATEENIEKLLSSFNKEEPKPKAKRKPKVKKPSETKTNQ